LTMVTRLPSLAQTQNRQQTVNPAKLLMIGIDLGTTNSLMAMMNGTGGEHRGKNVNKLRPVRPSCGSCQWRCMRFNLNPIRPPQFPPRKGEIAFPYTLRLMLRPPSNNTDNVDAEHPKPRIHACFPAQHMLNLEGKEMG
jgi:hypothetical protein